MFTSFFAPGSPGNSIVFFFRNPVGILSIPGIVGLFLLLSLISGSPAFGADKGTDLLNNAMNYYNQKMDARAISEFRSFLTQYPNHADRNQALYYLAEALVRSEKVDEAYTYYDEILGKNLSLLKTIQVEDSNFIDYYNLNIHAKMEIAAKERFAREALIRAGEVALIVEEDYQNARKYFLSFLVEFPKDPYYQWLLFYLGSIAMQNYSESLEEGDHLTAKNYAAEAEYYFSNSVDMFPQGSFFQESLFGLAWSEIRLGKYDSAIPRLKWLVSNVPKGPIAERSYYEWGDSHYEQGNYEDAISLLKYFESKFPQSDLVEDSVRCRAKSLAGLNRFRESLDLINTIKNRNPEDYMLQIRCTFGLQEFEKASKLLEELDRRPESRTVKDSIRAMQAAESARKGDVQNAISQLETLLRAKYDPRTREMTFAYLDPPERNTSGRGSYRPGDYGSSYESRNSNIGKLSEEAFLRACSALCLCYCAAGEREKSDATLNAMMKKENPDDKRHAHIISTTRDLSMKIAAGSFQPGFGGSSDLGSIPINPGFDGGIDFGQIPTVSDSDIVPIGGGFQRPSGPIADQKPGPNRRPNQEGAGNGSSGLMGNAKPLPWEQPPGNTGVSSGTSGSWSTSATDNIRKTQTQKQVLEECRRLIRSSRLEDADRKLLELLSSKPTNQTAAEAALLRCELLLKQGKEEEANVMCDLILNEFQSSTQYADALWLAGNYYEKNGQRDFALKYFQVIADEYPNNKSADGALFHLAWDDLEHEEFKAAKRKFRKVYSNYAHRDYWSHAAWGLAYIAYEERDYETSEKYVQEILNHPPDIAIVDRVLFLKGQLAMKREDWKVAQAAFQTIVRTSSDFDSDLVKAARSNANTALARYNSEPGSDREQNQRRR